ncbi:MAG: hypothetical protein K0U41_03245, partial [Gammaproteobacteria bacterium]|nr:hypothetical protein [Gammaproteobacteria bacterium]
MFKNPRVNALISGLSSMKASSYNTSTLYKVVTFTLAFLLVACAAGGGGGGSSAGSTPVSAFSHNSYAFAANVADNDVLDATPQVVGRVLLNNNRIRSLVAQRSGITDPQLISALAVDNGYSVSLSIDAAGNSDVATFFRISQDGIITVSNPFPTAGFTFGDVRGYLTDNSISVKLSITVASPSAAAANAIIVETVQVRILDSASRIDLADTTKPSLLLYNRNNVASPAGSRVTPATTETINLNGTLVGDRIAAGTTLGTNGEFSFSDLLPTATFTAGATPPAGGVIASPGNVFSAADIHTATNITNILNVDVVISLNSDGSSLATGEIFFPAGTALSIVNGNLATAGSFLNQVAQLVTDASGGTLALLNSTTNTFNLNVTSWNVAYDFTRTFTTPAFTTSVPGSVNFAVSGDLDENTNELEDTISFGRPNDSTASVRNLISAFGITRNPARITGTASQATLFYALRSTNNANACGNGDIYLDNNDLTVKAGALFNHENVAEYDCRLTVSADGENYRPLVFVLNAGASVNVTGNEFNFASQPLPDITIVS